MWAEIGGAAAEGNGEKITAAFRAPLSTGAVAQKVGPRKLG